MGRPEKPPPPPRSANLDCCCPDMIPTLLATNQLRRSRRRSTSRGVGRGRCQAKGLPAVVRTYPDPPVPDSIHSLQAFRVSRFDDCSGSITDRCTRDPASCGLLGTPHRPWLVAGCRILLLRRFAVVVDQPAQHRAGLQPNQPRPRRLSRKRSRRGLRYPPDSLMDSRAVVIPQVLADGPS